MKKNCKIYYFCALLSLLFLLAMSRRAVAQEIKKIPSWYVGVQGGVPLGISTFSSFEPDKTRIGWSGGLYGGYRFNSTLSIEGSVALSKLGLGAQNCCIERGYWLGVDGVRYNTPVSGMEGYSYADVMSRVSLLQYGVHLNVNLLGLFAHLRESRWSLNLSPSLYAVGTEATLSTISTDAPISKGATDWHLGMGGDVLVEYQFTHHFSVGVYSGVTYLSGKRMDGIPEYCHKNNFVWESGIRLGWTFGCKRQKSGKSAIPISVTQRVEPTPAPVSPETTAPEPQAVDKVDVKVTTSKETNKKLTFPVIYFSFDSTTIGADQREKLQKIKQVLEQYPNINITITGWCDANGSETINSRYSLRRAESVKQWLVENGIDAEKIQTLGGGIDRQATSPAKARRTETEERRN